MLIGMGERGPDSSGLAVFTEPLDPSMRKYSLYSGNDSYDWVALAEAFQAHFGSQPHITAQLNHAILAAGAQPSAVREWLKETHPFVYVLSTGRTIDLYKDTGSPETVINRYGFRNLKGAHLIGHTRMATESAVTPAHAHPFTAGEDFCLVHNGSLSNPYSIRRQLEPQGIHFEIDRAHNLAVGIDRSIEVHIQGHAGYYAGGMNQLVSIASNGNVSTGVAENMMSGRVHVNGFASGSAGASAHGGLLVIEGDAGLRCGISLKGADTVVGGNVGSFSGFMAQAGRLVVCGNAGDALGDSLYEAVIYIRGNIKFLGADAQLQPMTEANYTAVADLLDKAGLSHNPKAFKRVASAKTLYHWNADAQQDY